MTHIPGEGYGQPVEQIRDLQHYESLFLSADTPPIYSAEESFQQLGINAPLKAFIQASSEKSFMIFDLADASDPVFPDAPHKHYYADYLIADENFSPDTSYGYKGIRHGEPAIQIGRSHYANYFEYSDGVSRRHFSVESDEMGLTVINHAPPNGTKVIYSALEGVSDDIPETPLFRGYGLAELAHKGDDRSLALGKAALFGVFDGVGGDMEGGEAAQHVVNHLTAAYGRDTWSPTGNVALDAVELHGMLGKAGESIVTSGIRGSTTGTVLQIIKDSATDQQLAVWASVGDSRLYHAHDERSSQVTNDESIGHHLFNSLGPQAHGVRQSGRIALLGGDRLILVTDGITGDYGDDLLSDQEIAAALKDRDAPAAADELLRISRKQDDKTVIVIDI